MSDENEYPEYLEDISVLDDKRDFERAMAAKYDPTVKEISDKMYRDEKIVFVLGTPICAVSRSYKAYPAKNVVEANLTITVEDCPPGYQCPPVVHELVVSDEIRTTVPEGVLKHGVDS